MARNSRKCFSVNLVHNIFPTAHKEWKEHSHDDQGIGILEIYLPLQKLFHSIPFGKIMEVDLTGFSTFSLSFFLEFLQVFFY